MVYEKLTAASTTPAIHTNQTHTMYALSLRALVIRLYVCRSTLGNTETIMDMVKPHIQDERMMACSVGSTTLNHGGTSVPNIFAER